MTHLTDAPEQPAIAVRKPRPTESPRFWLVLALGSIALHAGLLLSMRWLNLRASLAVSAANPVPVELIEIAPDAAPPVEAIEPAPAASSAPLTADSVPPTVEAAPPGSAVPAAPEIAAQPPSEFTESLPQPSAAPVPSAPTAPSESPSPVPPPSPSSPAPTPPPEAIDPAAEPPPDSTPEPTQPQLPNPDGLPGGLTPAPIDPGLSEGLPDDTPDPMTGGNGTEGNLPSVDVGSEVTPARFVASVSASPIPPEEATDIPEQIAQPIESRRDFVNDAATSACEVAPEVMGYLGAPADFRIVIDTDPNDPSVGYIAPDEITLRQTSGSPAYDDLAACLLRDWEFRPAISQGTPPPSSEIIISVRIDPG